MGVLYHGCRLIRSILARCKFAVALASRFSFIKTIGIA
jgi:hypothetical protein